MMRRREFITLLGGAAAAWPLAARAQQAAVPVLGYLSAGGAASDAPYVGALRQGLSEGGYVEGQNIEILFHFAEGHFDRLPSLASDLIGRRVAVIFASGGAPALAAKAATTTIPIVFEAAYDPVAIGLVERLNRPGRNITGTSPMATAYYAKSVELLHELVPSVSSIALLTNPASPIRSLVIKEAESAAGSLGLRLMNLSAGSGSEIEQAFTTLAKEGSGGLVASGDRLWVLHRDLLTILAARYRVPTIYEGRDLVQAGGLISYGGSFIEAHRSAGNYVARILKGEKPADLPVQQVTKLELTINLKTAKALGVTIPPLLLARADEVIE